MTSRVYKSSRPAGSRYIDVPPIPPLSAGAVSDADHEAKLRAYIDRHRATQACGPIPLRPEIQQPSDAVPIWLAALLATRCLATSQSENHTILWHCVAGRAIYTNLGTETELIQPLGVRLHRGDTLAVTWTPGETKYTLEVYPPSELVA